MKDFVNSTKMQMGHNFPRTAVAVGAHQRAMPTKTPTMPMPQAAPGLAVTPPSPTSAKGLSPSGFPPRQPRFTLKESGRTGVRPPRTSQVEPTDGDEGFAKGGRITGAKRKGLLKSEFGLPGSRKYPMPDKSHAANAKARATQMVNAGKLSPSSKAKIDAKANRVLKKADGGYIDGDSGGDPTSGTGNYGQNVPLDPTNGPKKVDPKTGETITKTWEQKYYKSGFLNPDFKTPTQTTVKINPALNKDAYAKEARARGVPGYRRGGPVRDPRTPMISPKSGC